ncbi:MAG: aldo/keto reductase, partial [Candidatus Cloacimonetes bacterium]|nr:aldo/keto reductase [Candidatus Cloacimonadota bacterium]
VHRALETGYRLIDTASVYGNEEGVGKAVRESDLPREEVFVTSKVWNTDQGYERTLKAFDKSMNRLGLDYLDLYLIHWPVSDLYKDTWKALEKLYNEGRIRAIGVSNFLIHHLKDLMEDAEITPMVNQVEFHPHLVQQELHDFCQKNQIQSEAWAPLMRGKVNEIPLLKGLAEKYEKTPAQIVLRWDLQKGVATIPKSSNPERIRSNADIFDFELSEGDVKRIDDLEQGGEERVTGEHPDQY